MKRTHIFIGLVAFALLVFASITATLAAPGNIPFLQSTSETEPNNSFDEADEVGMPDPGYIIGEVYNTPVTETLDYFVMDTTVGYKYQANLTIDSPQGLNLKMVLWNGNRQCMDTSSSSSSSTSLSWTASYTSHYIRVEAVTISTSTLKTANYRLDVFERAEPTDTPEPTNTLSPNPWDEYEPNDSLGEPSDDASIGATLENLNFWPYEAYTEEEANAIEDVDVFRVWCKPGHTCRAKAAVTTGVDTMVKVYADDATDPSEPTIVENDDYGETLGSQVTWQSSASGDGYYKIWIENLDRSPRQSTGQTYNLTLIDLVATPTPTPTPGPSPTPGPGINPKSDSCEDNLDFAHACVIPANQSQTFNFVPPYGGVDNDYFKIWVKPGLIYDCATSSLDPGVDTNMILYDHNRNGIGGNDDVEPGNPESAFSYYATYNGWLYLLVGVGDRTPSDVYNSNYTLRCDRRVPGQPTATPTPQGAEPTNTPEPTTTPGTPTATPTPAPSEGLTVRTLTTPTPVPAMTPAPQFVPISLLVYYDANDDHQPGAGEGIAGVSAQAYEAATNQLLAQGFTDEQGNLEFTVAAQGPVRVSVPFFGFSQLVAGEGGSIYVRVSPQPLPGEAP